MTASPTAAQRQQALRELEPEPGLPTGVGCPPLPPLAQALVAALGTGGVAELDPDVSDDRWREALVGPALAFLDRPGKDLRARLVRAGWTLAGKPATGMPASLPRSIELLHAGSLIVDDVQDGSDHRRGAPSLHKLVGEPLAINTGSWMYFWALAELSRLGIAGALERAVAILVRAHQGQALDLSTRITELEMREAPGVVAATTRLKTGALCRLAMELGAMAAGAPPRVVVAIGALGESAGMALQMLDDLGCIVASERRGKACEDLLACRPTWPWAWLAASGDAVAWSALCSQMRALAAAGDRSAATVHACALAATLAERVEALGRESIRTTIANAIAAAKGVLPAAPLAELAADLRAMESRYG